MKLSRRVKALSFAVAVLAVLATAAPSYSWNGHRQISNRPYYSNHYRPNNHRPYWRANHRPYRHYGRPYYGGYRGYGYRGPYRGYGYWGPRYRGYWGASYRPYYSGYYWPSFSFYFPFFWPGVGVCCP